MIEHLGHFFHEDEIIESLKSQVTPERWQNIQNVVNHRDGSMAVVLEGIYDRGNASAVMRSAEAFGFYQIHHIELSDEFKESKRVTQGADKWLLQKKWTDTRSCIDHLKTHGFKIAVTHLEGGKPIDEVDFSTPVAICLGNEKDGASETLTKLADERVFIPMQGFVQSFNISVAAALCFQHIARKRQAYSGKSLSDAQKQQLLARYLLRSLKNPDPHMPAPIPKDRS
ncbi:MAG: RNA methyltransferase [Bdellovibrionales bacterium]|nr:RNA methyltransferase [Bdellovibrionales bacterium]